MEYETWHLQQCVSTNFPCITQNLSIYLLPNMISINLLMLYKDVFSNKESMLMKREQALALKKELEEGLEKWSKQVLEVQENNLKRAEAKVEDRTKLRRQRSREERRGREKRVMERRKESKEREAQEMRSRQEAISSKDKKVIY